MTRAITTMTIDDALHYTPEQRASIIASYPAHEREARANRIESEILASGPVQLVRAFWTAELDYPLYYRTLPAESARASPPRSQERQAVR